MGEDYEGYLPESPEQTFYVGNYYKAPVEGYVQATGGAPSQPCTQAYCVYFPYVANIIRENISYYYADAQRIAMNKNGEVYYLYGDQLGSVSAVADADGNQISKSLYHSWGTTRSRACIQETDYGYTGHTLTSRSGTVGIQVGDIYFYNAHWPQVPETKWRGYDLLPCRFKQSSTLVPPKQGNQIFDRYAYFYNNPVNGVFLLPNITGGDSRLYLSSFLGFKMG